MAVMLRERSPERGMPGVGLNPNEDTEEDSLWLDVSSLARPVVPIWKMPCAQGS